MEHPTRAKSDSYPDFDLDRKNRVQTPIRCKQKSPYDVFFKLPISRGRNPAKIGSERRRIWLRP